jgi:ubiquitin C-terminal hydrolase
MIDHIDYTEIKRIIPDGFCVDLRYDIADALNYLIDKINEELENPNDSREDS